MIDSEKLQIKSIKYKYEHIELTLSQLFDGYYVSLHDSKSGKYITQITESDLEPGYLALSIIEEYLEKSTK